MALIAHSQAVQTVRQTTTSTTNVDITSVSIADTFFNTGDKYLILASGQFDTASIDDQSGVTTLHGSTEFDGADQFTEHAPGSNPQKQDYFYFTVWTAVATEGIKMQFRTGGIGTTGADQVVLTAIRLNDLVENTDWHFNENLTDTTLTLTFSTTNNASITFTPPVAGDNWLVISRSRGTWDISLSNQIESRFTRSGEASFNTSVISQERETLAGLFQIQPNMHVFNLGAVSNTFTQESRIDETNGTDSRTDSAIFAINLAKFSESSSSATTTGTVDITTTDFGELVESISITPVNITDVFILGNFVLDNGTDSGGEARLQVDNVDSPATQTSDAYDRNDGWDGKDQGDFLHQTIINLSASAHTIDMDASAVATGPDILNSSLIAFALATDVPTKTFTVDAILFVFEETFTVDAMLKVIQTETFTIDARLLGVDELTFKFVEVTADQSHTGDANFADIPGAIIDSSFFVTGRKYLIVVTTQAVGSNINTNYSVRTLHGSTELDGSEHVFEPNAVATRTQYSYFNVWTAVAGEGIKMQFKTMTPAQTVSADQTTLFALEISEDFIEGVDWHSDAILASTVLAQTPTVANNATITFTPPVAGDDWLVMTGGCVDTDALNILYTSRTARSGEATSTTPSTTQEGEDAPLDLYVQTVFRVFTLGNASNTFEQEAFKSGSQGPNSTREYSTVFAINLNKFKSHSFAYTDGTILLDTTDNLATSTQVQTDTLAPTTAGNTWIMGSFVTGGNAFQEIRARMQVDQVDQIPTQTSDNYQQLLGYDPDDENNWAMQTVEDLDTSSHITDIDVTAETGAPTSDRTAQFRNIFEVRLEIFGVVIQTETFLVDALLQATQTETFLVDAFLQALNQEETFLVDGILQATFTETFLVDAFLQATQTETFLVDAILQATQTETFLVDAFLQATQTEPFTVDAFVLKTQTETFTVDGLVQKTQTETFTTDAILRATFTETFTIDAFVQATQIFNFTIDALIQGEITEFFLVDAFLQDTFVEDFLVDGRLAQRELFTIDARIVREEKFDIDARLAQREIFTIDAKLAKVAEFTIDARIVREEKITVDAVLAKVTEFDIDAVLAKVTEFDIDALLAKVAEFTIDARLAQLAEFDIDARIVREEKIDIDALLAKVAEFTIDARLAQREIFTIDSILASIEDFTIDAQLIDRNIETFTIDARLLLRQTETFDIDSILKATIDEDFTVDGQLIVSNTFDFTVDAELAEENTKIFIIDSILIGTKFNFLVNAIVISRNELDFTIDTQILALQPDFEFKVDAILASIKEFTIDGIPKALGQTEDFTINAQLIIAGQEIFEINALLQDVFTKDFTIEAVLRLRKVKEFIVDPITLGTIDKTFTIDAELASPNTKIFSIDAVLKIIVPETVIVDVILLKTQTKDFTIDTFAEAESTDFNFTINAIVKSFGNGVCGVGFGLSDLKAYWNFDETGLAGKLFNQATAIGSPDSLGTSADGNYFTGFIILGSVGQVNTAYKFTQANQASNRIGIGTSNSQFNFMHNTTALFTVNFWINPIVDTFADLMIDQNNSGSNRGVGIAWGSSGGSNGQVALRIRNNADVINANSGIDSIPVGTLSMVTITYDHSLGSNNARFYVNGVETNVASKTAFVASNANANFPLQVGTRANNQNGVTYGGILDEASIWNRVLTPTEITELFELGESGIPLAQSLSTECIRVDSFVKALDQEKQFTVDAVLPATFDEDFTTNAILVVAGQEVFEINALVSLKTPKLVTVDAIVVLRPLETFDIDAQLSLVKTTDFTTDAIIKPVQFVEFTIDAQVLGQSFDKIFEIDALLKVLGQQKVFTIDGNPAGATSIIFQIDSIVKAFGQTEVFTVDALITRAKLFTIDAFILRPGDLLCSIITPAFEDSDFTSGWTTIGTQIRINDPSFPNLMRIQCLRSRLYGGVQQAIKPLTNPVNFSVNEEIVWEFSYNNLSPCNPSFGGNGEFAMTATSTLTGDIAQGKLTAFIRDNGGVIGAGQRLFSRYSDGTNTASTTSDGFISLPGGISFIRVTKSVDRMLIVEAFSDSARTIPLAGSPRTVDASSVNAVPLSFMQMGSVGGGGPARFLRGEIDDITADNSKCPRPRIDSFIQALDQEEDFTVDARIVRETSFTVDAILRASQLKTFTVDTLSLGLLAVAFSIDAVLKREKKFNIDVILEGVTTELVLVDALLQGVRQRSFSLNINLSRQVQFTIDARFTPARRVTIDTILIPSPIEINVDAIIIALPELDFIIDGLISITNDLDFTIDSTIVKAGQVSVDARLASLKEIQVDALLAPDVSKFFLIDAQLKILDETEVFTTDARLRDTFTKSFTIDVIIINVKQKLFTVSAFIGRTKLISIDAILDTSIDFTVDTLIKQIGADGQCNVRPIPFTLIDSGLEHSATPITLAHENGVELLMGQQVTLNNQKVRSVTFILRATQTPTITVDSLLDARVWGIVNLGNPLGELTLGTSEEVLNANESSGDLPPGQFVEKTFRFDPDLLSFVTGDFVVGIRHNSKVNFPAGVSLALPVISGGNVIPDSAVQRRGSNSSILNGDVWNFLTIASVDIVIQLDVGDGSEAIEGRGRVCPVIDSILVNTPEEFDIDAIIKRIRTKDFTIDALIDANLQLFTLDSILIGTKLQFTIDSLIVPLPVPFTIDGITFVAPSAIINIDAILVGDGFQELFLVDALIQITKNSPKFNINVRLIRAGQTEVFTVDSTMFKITGSPFTISAIILSVPSEVTAIDGIVKALNQQVFPLTRVDALLLEEIPEDFEVNALIFKRNSNVLSVNAILKTLNVEEGFIVTASLSVRRPPVNFTVNAIILLPNRRFRTDALLRGEITELLIVDAILVVIPIGTATIDAFISTKVGENFDVDTILTDENQELFTVGASLETGNSVNFIVDIIVLQLNQESFTLDTILKRQKVFTIDPLIQALGGDGNSGGEDPYIEQPDDDGTTPIPIGTLVGQRLRLPSVPVRITDYTFTIHRSVIASPTGTLTGKIFKNSIAGNSISGADLLATSDNSITVSSITTDTGGQTITFTFTNPPEISISDNIFIGFDVSGSNVAMFLHITSNEFAIDGGDVNVESSGNWGVDLGVDAVLEVNVDTAVRQRASAQIDAFITGKTELFLVDSIVGVFFEVEEDFTVDAILIKEFDFTISAFVGEVIEQVIEVESVIIENLGGDTGIESVTGVP